jgi:hypothetical protein
MRLYRTPETLVLWDFKRRSYSLLFRRECNAGQCLIAAKALYVSPFENGSSKHHVPLQRFICGMAPCIAGPQIRVREIINRL